KRVTVSDEGDFLIGFGRNARRRARLSFSTPEGWNERHVLHVAPRDFEPEAIDGLPPELVELDRDTQRRLAKAKRRIDKVRKHISTAAHFREGWQWPTRGKLTSTYGRKRILNGVDKGFHWGVDVAAPVG